MHFIELIKDQAALAYTGRINILSSNDKQYRGHICMQSGAICYAQFDGECGLDQLYFVISQDLYLSPFSFISEPEMIDKKYHLFSKSIPEIINESREYYKSFLQAHQRPPPDNLKLAIDTDCLFRTKALGPIEFDLLTIVLNFPKFSDIINHSKLGKIRCIMALIKLRERKILRVYKEVER